MKVVEYSGIMTLLLCLVSLNLKEPSAAVSFWFAGFFIVFLFSPIIEDLWENRKPTQTKHAKEKK